VGQLLVRKVDGLIRRPKERPAMTGRQLCRARPTKSRGDARPAIHRQS
jgi:hypothetical protein